MKPLRLTACINARGTFQPTGQGKHAIHMLLGLAARPDVQLSVLVAREQLDTAGRIPAESPLAGLPVCSYALPQRIMHGLWRTIGRPAVEWWCPDSDWFYCPTENFVAARRTAFAATIHCADWFETDVPWAGSSESEKGRQRMGRLYRCIFREASMVFTVSEFLKWRLCELFDADPARVTVIGNGVEQCFFEAGTDNAAVPGQNSRRLLAVGALQPRKGAEYLLALGEILTRRKSDLRLVVAGGTAGWPDFVARARACPNMEVLPYVSSAELAGLMRDSLAVVNLARSESFGIPAVEAMAVGVPVIASRFMALPEVVGGAGFLVDATRPDEIADLAIAMSTQPALRDRHLALGRQRAAAFTWPACVERLVQTLRACS